MKMEKLRGINKRGKLDSAGIPHDGCGVLHKRSHTGTV